MKTSYAKLGDRRLLSVGGDDAVEFLQGLVTNDVRQPISGQPVFAALLTPQGKFLHDFFVVADQDVLLLDVEVNGIDDLKRRLTLFRLRSKVTIEPASENLAVWAVWGPEAGRAKDLSAAYVDRRHEAMGSRLITDKDPSGELQALGFTPSSADAYDEWRLTLGVPSGSKDLKRESSALLESNYDVLEAISWDKGCYMGQELTARTRYRGLVKRRLAQITFDGNQIPFGTPVELDGRQVGDIRSTANGKGLASMRLEALQQENDTGFQADGIAIRAQLPAYVEAKSDQSG